MLDEFSPFDTFSRINTFSHIKVNAVCPDGSDEQLERLLPCLRSQVPPEDLAQIEVKKVDPSKNNNKPVRSLEVVVKPGVTIRDAARTAGRLSRLFYGVPVDFAFNRIPLRVIYYPRLGLDRVTDMCLEQYKMARIREFLRDAISGSTRKPPAGKYSTGPT